MKIDIEVVEAKPSDVDEMVNYLPQDIIDEILVSTGKEPKAVVASSVEKAEEAYTVRYKGEIVCMFGFYTLAVITDEAYPWLLPTTRLKDIGWIFTKCSRNWIKYLSSRFSILRNAVLSQNTEAIKWLKWLGFTMHKEVIVNGHKFTPYSMIRAEKK